MNASPALPLQRVLHLVEGVGRVCGGNAVERHLLPRAVIAFALDTGLYLKQPATATDVSPHHSKFSHHWCSIVLAMRTGAPLYMLHAMCGIRLYSNM